MLAASTTQPESALAEPRTPEATPGAAPVRPQLALGPGLGLLRRTARVGLLVAADLVALVVSGGIAYLLWALPVHRQSPELYLSLAPLLILFLLAYAQAGLYPGFGLGPVETLRRLTYSTGFIFLLLASVSFAFKLPHLYSRMTFALAFALALVVVPLVRAATVGLASQLAWWREPVVLVGSGGRLRRVIAALDEAPRLGYSPAAVLVSGGAGDREASEVPRTGGLELAPELARRGVRVALVAEQTPPPATVLDELQQHFRHVVLLRALDDLPVEGIEVRNLGGLLGIEYTNNLLLTKNRVVKRLLDLVVGGGSLLLALPLMVLAALLVKVVSRGPVLFVQERVGLGGHPVQVPKIRTMRVDAEERLAAYLESHPELARQWTERMKLERDPRLIPWVGRLLRRLSLDELPQLALVVTGEMSLVGPRPFPEYHLTRFQTDFRRLRCRVRPGLTGLWQVTVRGDGGVEEQEALDTYYIRNWSLWLDLVVLARTAGAVLSGRGAY